MIIRTFDQSLPDLTGKRVLVTGGTGSFGQSFVELMSKRFDVERLVVFSRDEHKQADMQAAFPPDRYPFLRFFIGDVRDNGRLDMAMRGIDYVIHAAALKHVPAAEYNPFEYVRTNIIGAENVVSCSIRNNVEKVIALSTDKAANPINLYGATKLASDKIFVAGNNLSGLGGTRFSVVRYGNVVGSRGSIVPVFQRMIAQGVESLPITDPRMTRFWITLRQGVFFVLSSLGMMRGGEVFIPKIPSMKVTDLASIMAPGLAQHTIGIRPGEKLHEIMVPVDDARNTFNCDDRFVIEPAKPAWESEDRAPIGSPVPDEFAYSSDQNDEWLDKAGFETLMRMASGDP